MIWIPVQRQNGAVDIGMQRLDATTENLRRAISGRGETVVAVGHQPDCGRIAAELTGGDEPPFPPGGMVRIEVS